MARSIQTEILITASRERVWNILTDFAAYPGWNPFIISILGTLTEGGTLTNTMLNGSRRFVFKPVVQRVVPLTYFDWVGRLGFRGIFDGHHYFELEDLGAGQVRLRHGEHFSGLLSGYLLRKIGEETRNNFIKMNEAVKARAEQS